jgi:hypothetical protein
LSPSSSLRVPELESLPTRDLPLPSTSSLNSHPLAKTSSYWEVPETERLRGISVSTPDNVDPTLLPELDQRVESSRELEEEDDHSTFYLTQPFSHYLAQLLYQYSLYMKNSFFTEQISSLMTVFLIYHNQFT